MHVQHMLKMSRFYTLAEISSKIFVKKKQRKTWDLILRSWFDILTIWCQLNFYKNILCDHCLHNLHLYIRKMLTSREMVSFKKNGTFFDFSLYFDYKWCLTGALKCLLSICFALFVANNA